MSDEPGDDRLCSRCGLTGGVHQWQDDDCILPHRGHSTNLLPGAHVCLFCIERHRDWLAEIVELYAGLTDVLLAGSIPDDTAAHQHTKKAPASPSPLRLDAWALLYGQLNDHVVDLVVEADGTRTLVEHAAWLGSNLPNVPAVLAGWAQAAFDAQGWTDTAPNTVTGATAALRTAAEIMARLPDVDTYDAELRWVRRALRGAHGLRQPQDFGACLTVTANRSCSGRVIRETVEQPHCKRCNRVYGTNDLVRLRMNERRGATA